MWRDELVGALTVVVCVAAMVTVPVIGLGLLMHVVDRVDALPRWRRHRRSSR